MKNTYFSKKPQQKKINNKGNWEFYASPLGKKHMIYNWECLLLSVSNYIRKGLQWSASNMTSSQVLDESSKIVIKSHSLMRPINIKKYILVLKQVDCIVRVVLIWSGLYVGTLLYYKLFITGNYPASWQNMWYYSGACLCSKKDTEGHLRSSSIFKAAKVTKTTFKLSVQCKTQPKNTKIKLWMDPRTLVYLWLWQ